MEEREGESRRGLERECEGDERLLPEYERERDERRPDEDLEDPGRESVLESDRFEPEDEAECDERLLGKLSE